MNKTNTSELLTQLNDLFNIYNKLNNITYHNLQKTKKLIQDINKKGTNNYELIKEIKIHLYVLHLTLEEINETINNYMENNNE